MTAARACTFAQAGRFRRRHQPRRPPLAKSRPGRPASAMGPGTARHATGRPLVRHRSAPPSVATDALAVAVDPQPRISLADAATVTMEDTTPLPIVDGSSTRAPNTRRLWQTDSIGIRLTMQLSFGLRHTAGAAFISSVTW